jgi:hypothetical protein
MRYVIAAVVALVALAGSTATAGVKRSVVAAPETTIWTVPGTSGSLALASAAPLGGYTLPTGRGYTVTAITLVTAAASGGGAGNTVITLTDGTNTCTVTATCASTQPAAPVSLRIAAAHGTGAGCAFPASASVTASVTTAGCTTTQPGIRYLSFVGNWR